MSLRTRWFILFIPVVIWYGAHLINTDPTLFLRAQLLLRGHPFAKLVLANLDMANVDNHVSAYIIHEGGRRIGYVDGCLGVHLDQDTPLSLDTGGAVCFGSFFLQAGCVVFLPIALLLAIWERRRRVGFPVSLSNSEPVSISAIK